MSSQLPNRVRGMQDWYGDQQRYYTFLKKIARHIFRHHSATRISTPMVEMQDLISRGVGEETDVVSKELYAFQDKKGRDLCLKPESTAGVMRAYFDHFTEEPSPVYLYYIEPHFRYDRPQKGRFRQFNQIGIEIIGEKDAILDAENIYMAHKILVGAGLNDGEDFVLKINSLGSLKDREKYIDELQGFFENKKHALDETDLRRLEHNPLRLLDSKNPDVRDLLEFAPKITDFLGKDAKKHYADTKLYLEQLEIPYEEDHTLVRGLDYYNDVVFEFVDSSGRTQDSLGGGGRYDTLATTLGAKNPVPSCGFGLGVERIIDAMMDKGYTVVNKDRIDLYFIQLGDEAKKVALPLSIHAREIGLKILSSFGTPSMRTQLKKASRIGAKYAAIIGIMEAKKGVCILKNMENGTQEELSLDELIPTMIDHIGGEEHLDSYDPTEERLFDQKLYDERNNPEEIEG